MDGSVVIQYFYLAQTVVQLDRFVARNQPLAILPPLATIKQVAHEDLVFPLNSSGT